MEGAVSSKEADWKEISIQDVPENQRNLLEGCEKIYQMKAGRGYSYIGHALASPTQQERDHLHRTVDWFALRSTARAMGINPESGTLQWSSTEIPQEI